MYTDGSCLKNPGFGGWAYILRYNQHQKEGFGAQANTTNNRMELKAIIEALKALKEPCEISLFTDSNLMVQSINAVSYTHLRAHETPEHLVCRLLLEKKK
ncbi:RNase H family protein, partial [Campylobacter coli]|uniref:RNase H family protein n=1 Tax=Campylobacter coli TaxID=195 RepID=UPI002B4ADDBC